jgi:starch synthase
MKDSLAEQPQLEIKEIVHVSREYRGLAGAGGIKDVTEGLCRAAAAKGIKTHVCLPYYRTIERRGKSCCDFDINMNYPNEQRTEHVKVWTDTLANNLELHLIDTPRYQYLFEGDNPERQGIYQYTQEEAEAIERPELEGKGYFDFFAMNVLLVKATLRAIERLKIKPDMIHCHDGHTALLPLIAQTSEDDFAPFLHYVPTLITVHNAGKGYHQEIGDIDFAAALCGIPHDVANACILDNCFDPLIAGGLFGSAINTVSENYARELRFTGQDWMTGWLGHTLAGYGIELLGVTNGVDLKAHGFQKLVSPESKEKFKKKTLNITLERETPPDITIHGSIDYQKDTPLLTFIGRLDWQKGYDILADAIDLLFGRDANVQLLGLGSGDPKTANRFKELAEKFPGRVCFIKGYSPKFAEELYAAGDFFIIPSRFEPCGLTDFSAQLKGNVPIVHKIGGLVKTLDGHFGFSYLGGAQELFGTLEHALGVYREPDKKTLREIQASAVKNIQDNFTWDKVLEKKYIPIYHNAIAQSKPTLPY